MADNNKKIEIYSKYIDLLTLMVSDMSNINIGDIQNVLDELDEELNK